MGKSRLGLLDLGAAVAIGIFVVGAFLPFTIARYVVMTVTANLLSYGGGIIAVLTALAAIVLTVNHVRIGAIAALLVAGSIVGWRVVDLGSTEGFSLGFGAYAMAAGILGGLGLLILGLVRSRHDSLPSGAWLTPDTEDNLSEPDSLRAVYAEDPVPITE